ncbi:MAG: RdgB/HAM1 family non-canonical purine NTP pyrophosphatase [Bacteroidales bacterium]|nr:RdgB/HAM1 family non-canonical purine NTP pyrophosphatase [Bacteroidales bacterium]
MEIIFATGNIHKVVEAQKALGDGFTLIMPKDLGIKEDIPETGDTLEINALQKCQYLWERFHKPCFADDTGLEVEALDGAPGVHTARYAGESKEPTANMDKLLLELEGVENRRARFRTAVSYIDKDGESHLFEGILNGAIALEKSGTEGFGYDPVFIPDGYSGKTLAEVTLEEKNAISHRGKAMRSLMEYLRNAK